MSRTFKRPMFRIGGNVGTGIMSGIVDRTHAADGFPIHQVEHSGMPLQEEEIIKEEVDVNPYGGDSISVEEAIAQLKEGAGEYGGMDPLTSYLLRAGPSIAKSKNFSDLIANLDPANKGLIEDAAARGKYDRGLRLAGVKRAMGQKDIREGKFLDYEADKLKTKGAQEFTAGQAELKRDFDTLSQSNYWKNQDERTKDLWAREDSNLLKLWTKQDERILDKRAYDELQTEEKQKYDAKLLEQAKEYAALTLDEKRAWDQKQIDEGREWEMEKMKERIKLEVEANDPLSEKSLTIAFMKDYENKTQAGNRAKYEANGYDTLMKEKFTADRFGGLIGGDQHGSLKSKEKKKNLGKVYYDVTDGTVKRLRRTEDGYRWESIDIETYEAPETDTNTAVGGVDKSGQEYLEGVAASLGIEYEIIPPRDPEFTGKSWNDHYKRNVNPNAVTLGELQKLISKEQLRLLVERKKKPRTSIR